MTLKKATPFCSYVILLCNCFLFIYLEYFLDRSNFYNLFLGWTFLFLGSYYLVYFSKFSLKQLFYIGVILRSILLIATPPMSQDFNRFIWDGRMLFQGFNPYLTTPKLLIESGTATIQQAQQLFDAMGMLNASHYTNYPPVSQFCYAIAALFGSKSILASIIALRTQLILADIGVFWIGKKILHKLKLNTKNISLYFINPFIILELTGNLHFEGVMAFFMLLSIYFLIKNKWFWSALSLGIAINVKLLPLLFLPVFFLYFLNLKSKGNTPLFLQKINGFKNYLLFCFVAIAINILFFVPFFSNSFITNFSATIGLWFQNFEFNASIYYIIRWIGFKVVGWNIIGTVGKILPIIVILIILLLSLIRKNADPKTLIESMLFSVSAYLLLSTTVHPWYLTIPLALSILTNYKYVLIWSWIVIVSYNAYSHLEFKENLAWVTLEYSIVIAVFCYEVFVTKVSKKPFAN